MPTPRAAWITPRIEQLASLAFVRDKLNLLITGPTGVGKSYLACALGQ